MSYVVIAIKTLTNVNSNIVVNEKTNNLKGVL